MTSVKVGSDEFPAAPPITGSANLASSVYIGLVALLNQGQRLTAGSDVGQRSGSLATLSV